MSANRESYLPRMIFLLKNKKSPDHFCIKIAAIEATSFTAECRKSVWPFMKRMVNKQKEKNQAKTLNVGEWEQAPLQD